MYAEISSRKYCFKATRIASNKIFIKNGPRIRHCFRAFINIQLSFSLSHKCLYIYLCIHAQYKNIYIWMKVIQYMRLILNTEFFLYKRVNIYIYLFISLWENIYIYPYVYVCVCVCMCVYVYICVCVCIYIYYESLSIYKYIYIHM